MPNNVAAGGRPLDTEFRPNAVFLNVCRDNVAVYQHILMANLFDSHVMPCSCPMSRKHQTQCCQAHSLHVLDDQGCHEFSSFFGSISYLPDF